ncbi:MAG TPA: hypothetical protein EYN91_11565 [Candidatus Melainabacteria bacterium]|nr:hypothetical protein [Candidatus Melainabacteria bacterium]
MVENTPEGDRIRNNRNASDASISKEIADKVHQESWRGGSTISDASNTPLVTKPSDPLGPYFRSATASEITSPKPGTLIEGHDGFALVVNEKVRVEVNLDRARLALDNKAEVTIRIAGPEQARQLMEWLRERNGSMLLAKNPYKVEPYEIKSANGARVSTSENPMMLNGERLPVGTVIEDGKIRSAHPNDTGVTVGGRLIPNGTTVSDYTGGQHGEKGSIIPARYFTNLQGERVMDGYPLTLEQFNSKFEKNASGDWVLKANANPVEHTILPPNVTVEFYKVDDKGNPVLDANGRPKIEAINKPGSAFRADGYSLTPDILVSTWNKFVDSFNSNLLLNHLEKLKVGNTLEARALRDQVRAADDKGNFKASTGLTRAQLERLSEPVSPNPTEAAEAEIARRILRATSPEERARLAKGLRSNEQTQREILSGKSKGLASIAGAILALTGAAVERAHSAHEAPPPPPAAHPNPGRGVRFQVR